MAEDMNLSGHFRHTTAQHFIIQVGATITEHHVHVVPVKAARLHQIDLSDQDLFLIEASLTGAIPAFGTNDAAHAGERATALGADAVSGNDKDVVAVGVDKAGVRAEGVKIHGNAVHPVCGAADDVSTHASQNAEVFKVPHIEADNHGYAANGGVEYLVSQVARLKKDFVVTPQVQFAMGSDIAIGAD